MQTPSNAYELHEGNFELKFTSDEESLTDNTFFKDFTHGKTTSDMEESEDRIQLNFTDGSHYTVFKKYLTSYMWTNINACKEEK